MTRWEAAAQLCHNFGISKPRGNIAAFVQTLPELGTGNIEYAVALLHFVIGNIFVLVFEVDHHVERNHGDADVGFVLLENFLRFIGTVERLAVRVFARTRVVAANDEMCTTVILANESVPDSLAWSSHAHG